MRYETQGADWGSLAFQTDFQYRSEHFFNLAGLPAGTEDGYTVANASVTWLPKDEPWTVRVAVDNLTDEEYLVQTFDLSGTLASGGFFGMIEQYYGRPRMWSITFKTNF